MTRMECTQIDDLLMDYLYQELAPEQMDEFRAHLDSCVRCAREVQSFQGVREKVRELPVLEPPKGLTAQLLHQAAEAKKPAFPWLARLWELLQPRRTFYAVAAAASLVVVLFVGYAMQKGRVSRSFVAEERAVAEATTPTPATPAAAPAPAAAPGLGVDGLKAAPETKPQGGEAADKTAETLTEKDGKLAAGKGTAGYPVRVDYDSVRREQATGADPGWDTSNAARVADARRGGFGLGGRVEAPKDQVQLTQRELKKADGDGRPSFAQAPKVEPTVQTRAPQGVARGAQAAPIMNAPAGGPAAGPPRVIAALPQAAQAPAPQVQAKRAWQAPSAPPPPAPAEPAPAKEEAESGYYRRQGGGGPAAAPQAAPPAQARQRAAGDSASARDENLGNKAGEGFAQAPPDERNRMRANVDYKNAMGVGCEKQIKLLEDFVARYPWDNRVKEAKIRIAVCRARLTGQSDDIDAELRNMERSRQKKSLHEAEQRATRDRYVPPRAAPAPVTLERQTISKARKGGARPVAAPARAEKVQQAAKVAPVKASGKVETAKAKAPARLADDQAVAKGKAPAKPAVAAKPAAKPAAKAAPAATAAKAKKAAPARADEKSKSRPAAAETTVK
jgi:hypothetical protein